MADTGVVDVVVLRPQLCGECRQVALLLRGVLTCTLFNEPLLDERVAEDCLGFERDT